MSMSRRHRVPLDLRGLSGQLAIFRVAATRQQPDPAVDDWFAGEPVQLRTLARVWFQRMRQCGAAVREQVHDGCPVACVDAAPFGCVNAFRHHVNVGFFYGAQLADPAGLLEGRGKRMRHVKLYPDRPFLAEDALGDLIVAAYRDLLTRLAAERDAQER